MKKVIDVRDMHTGIHSLYIVNKKPKTTLKMFKLLVELELEEYSQPFWDEINNNTEYFGEINYRDIRGDKLWKGQELVSHNEYHDGNDNHFVLIGSFDLY